MKKKKKIGERKNKKRCSALWNAGEEADLQKRMSYTFRPSGLFWRKMNNLQIHMAETHMASDSWWMCDLPGAITWTKRTYPLLHLPLKLIKWLCAQLCLESLSWCVLFSVRRPVQSPISIKLRDVYVQCLLFWWGFFCFVFFPFHHQQNGSSALCYSRTWNTLLTAGIKTLTEVSSLEMKVTCCWKHHSASCM